MLFIEAVTLLLSINFIDENGRQDFSTTVKTFTLHSGSPVEQHQVCIDIIPDSISEPDEGFLLVLSVGNELITGSSMHHFDNGGVALAIILNDDDGK